MKILVVCQHYWPEPFNVTEMCEELVRRGHSVTVLTGRPDYSAGQIDARYQNKCRRNEVVNGVDIIRVPIVARGKDLRGINKIRRIANYFSFAITGSLEARRLGSDFDLVLAQQYSPILMVKPGITYARRNKVPLLIYCFDLWPEDLLTGGLTRNGLPYKAMKRVSARIYGAADLVMVTSPGFIDYFNNTLGLSGLNCEFLPQYAEEQFEDMGTTSRHASETVNFLFAGNIGGNQSVETIIEAANLVQDQDCIIHIVGSGSHYDHCRFLAQKYGLDNVIFHGRKPFDEMASFYQGADCMLLTLAKPSNGSLVAEHTIPRKLQSYIAAGKPVIASAPGASKDIVASSAGGLTCNPGDAQSLAEAMKKMVSLSDEERSEMSLKARDYYLRNYSRKRFFCKLEECLNTTKG